MTAVTHAPSLPEWLAPGSPVDVVRQRSAARAAQRALDAITFESLFDDFLDTVCENPLGIHQFFENDPRQPDYRRFVAWIMRDKKRKALYYDALEIGAEVMVLEIPVITSASDTIEDVNRSTLRANNLWKMIAVFNRKRFGDVKQIEQNVTIDLSGAMQQAQERLEMARAVDRARTVDGVTRRIE